MSDWIVAEDTSLPNGTKWLQLLWRFDPDGIRHYKLVGEHNGKNTVRHYYCQDNSAENKRQAYAAYYEHEIKFWA